MPITKDTKTFTGRMTMLHDTTENWNALRGFIPLAGEIVVYTDYKQQTVDGKVVNIPGIKIGTGNAYVQDLAFSNVADLETLVTELAERGVTISADDRRRWNNKLSVRDLQEVEGETLILRRE